MGVKTVFLIMVTTSQMIMPGMPKMEGGFNLGGKSIPGFGAPSRTMTMDLTSGKKADAKSKAECAVPDGLLVGPKVNLTIDLPEKTQPEQGTEETPEKPGKTEKMVFKSYWMCSETVPSGQPKVLDNLAMDFKGMDPKQMKAMKGSMRTFATDEGSHAYWPGRDARQLKDGSATPGGYELVTNYCGGTSITFDKGQDFLAPIEVVSPGKGKVDLEKAIKLEWKSVPNAVAYILMAFASGDNEMITWTSSSDPLKGTDITGKALSKAEVATYIEKGFLLPGTATSCSIPAGIFKTTKGPMIMMTALGVDKSQEKDGIKTEVVVRSTATIMLSMGMGMGAEEEQPEENGNEDGQEPGVNENGNDQGNNNGDEQGSDENANNGGKKPDLDKVLDTVDRVKGIFKH